MDREEGRSTNASNSTTAMMVPKILGEGQMLVDVALGRCSIYISYTKLFDEK